jgi:signal peptidase I
VLYIKRLAGLPGETIAIRLGKLHVLSPDRGLSYSDLEEAQGDPSKLLDLWRPPYMHHNDDKALRRFKEGQFEIVRKPPAILLEMMRLVYDNDHQANDLSGPEFERWVPASESGWDKDGKTGFRHEESGDSIGWLHYRHVLRDKPDKPQLITDFMGYNTWEAERDRGHSLPGENWATDLIVECNADVKTAQGNFVLELSKGPDRFQARFDLASGTCTLFRLTRGKKPFEMKSAPTRLKGKGRYQVRFANVDDRLVVWVDGRLPFDKGVEYPAADKLMPVKENDLERPVSVGTSGGVVVSGLKVYRDTYYTTSRSGPSSSDVPEMHFDDPETFKNAEDAPVSTYYVQPGHFLCLGDNSPESSDGRSWGLVPRRLLLGRALMVYYPFTRTGRIR